MKVTGAGAGAGGAGAGAGGAGAGAGADGEGDGAGAAGDGAGAGAGAGADGDGDGAGADGDGAGADGIGAGAGGFPDVGAEALGASAAPPPPPHALIASDKLNHRPFNWRNLFVFVILGPLVCCSRKSKEVSTLIGSCAARRSGRRRQCRAIRVEASSRRPRSRASRSVGRCETGGSRSRRGARSRQLHLCKRQKELRFAAFDDLHLVRRFEDRQRKTVR